MSSHFLDQIKPQVVQHLCLDGGLRQHFIFICINYLVLGQLDVTEAYRPVVQLSTYGLQLKASKYNDTSRRYWYDKSDSVYPIRVY